MVTADQALATAPCAKSVFINCPYDAAYEALLHTIVYTVVAYGFLPCSARTSESEAVPRIQRIVDTLSRCKYSIHDLSRFTGEGQDNLARFNMPLELGIAIGFGHVRQEQGRTHNWLLLVPGDARLEQFVSDLKAYDPFQHESTPQSVLREVSAWLRMQEDVIQPPPLPSLVLGRLPQFQAEIEQVRQATLNRLNWGDLVSAAEHTVARLSANAG